MVLGELSQPGWRAGLQAPEDPYCTGSAPAWFGVQSSEPEAARSIPAILSCTGVLCAPNRTSLAQVKTQHSATPLSTAIAPCSLPLSLGIVFCRSRAHL